MYWKKKKIIVYFEAQIIIYYKLNTKLETYKNFGL